MSKRIPLQNNYEYLVTATFTLIQEAFEGIVPAGKIDQDIYWYTKETGDRLKDMLENKNNQMGRGSVKAAGRIKGRQQAEAEILLNQYLAFAIDYLEQEQPWKLLEENRSACRNTVLNTLQMLANLTFWLGKTKEQTALSIQSALPMENTWKVHRIVSGTDLSNVSLPASISSNRRAVG